VGGGGNRKGNGVNDFMEGGEGTARAKSISEVRFHSGKGAKRIECQVLEGSQRGGL